MATKMAALLWTVVSALLLSQEVQAQGKRRGRVLGQRVTEEGLARIVNQLYNAYEPQTRTAQGEPPVFSLAVSVPLTPNQGYDVSRVIAEDNPTDVKDALDNCQVYEGHRVIGATVLKGISAPHRCPNTAIPDEWTFVKNLCPRAKVWGDIQMCTPDVYEQLKNSGEAVAHAEYRVLQSMNHLINRLRSGQLTQKEDLLVFYSSKSPCSKRCANREHPNSIVRDSRLSSITNWSNHVLVFSGLFKPPKTDSTEELLDATRSNALNNLSGVVGGLRKIYRCRIGSRSCIQCRQKVGASEEPVQACIRDMPRSRSPSPNRPFNF